MSFGFQLRVHNPTSFDPLNPKSLGLVVFGFRGLRFQGFGFRLSDWGMGLVRSATRVWQALGCTRVFMRNS